MIQPSELRIGNWVALPIVKHPNKEEVDKVFYSKIKSVSPNRAYKGGYSVWVHRKENREYFFDIAEISAIPLTPELLENIGFEKGCLSKNINKDWFIYYNDGMWLQVERESESGYVCERISMFHIKHLHQLQNWYHSLTGEELTIDVDAVNRSVATTAT